MEEKFKLENNSLEDIVKEQVEKDELDAEVGKRCVLCYKPFNSKNEIFGIECLMNMYDFLKIPVPSGIFKNKERYLVPKFLI